MKNWGMLLVGSFIISYICWRSRLYINLKYSRYDADDNLIIEVYVWRHLISYRVDIPVIELTRRRGTLWLESELETVNGENETCAQHEKKYALHFVLVYLRNLKRLRKLYRQIQRAVRNYKKIMHCLNKYIECRHFYWKTRFGYEDAALTGIMAGVMWALKTYILCDMSKRCQITTKPVICVEPIFNKHILEINFECIFSIRLGQIITTGFTAFLIIFKGGTGRG